MDKELELILVEKYPNLYKDYGKDMKKTCMHWGFSHGNGWYDLIDKLSEKLEPFGVVAAQVKEKFGSLRFYLNYPHHLDDKTFDKIREIKNEFELKSSSICENCGKPGKTISDEGWLRTICDKCYKKKI